MTVAQKLESPIEVDRRTDCSHPLPRQQSPSRNTEDPNNVSSSPFQKTESSSHETDSGVPNTTDSCVLTTTDSCVPTTTDSGVPTTTDSGTLNTSASSSIVSEGTPPLRKDATLLATRASNSLVRFDGSRAGGSDSSHEKRLHLPENGISNDSDEVTPSNEKANDVVAESSKNRLVASIDSSTHSHNDSMKHVRELHGSAVTKVFKTKKSLVGPAKKPKGVVIVVHHSADTKDLGSSDTVVDSELDSPAPNLSHSLRHHPQKGGTTASASKPLERGSERMDSLDRSILGESFDSNEDEEPCVIIEEVGEVARTSPTNGVTATGIRNGKNRRFKSQANRTSHSPSDLAIDSKIASPDLVHSNNIESIQDLIADISDALESNPSTSFRTERFNLSASKMNVAQPKRMPVMNDSVASSDDSGSLSGDEELNESMMSTKSLEGPTNIHAKEYWSNNGRISSTSASEATAESDGDSTSSPYNNGVPSHDSSKPLPIVQRQDREKYSRDKGPVGDKKKEKDSHCKSIYPDPTTRSWAWREPEGRNEATARNRKKRKSHTGRNAARGESSTGHRQRPSRSAGPLYSSYPMGRVSKYGHDDNTTDEGEYSSDESETLIAEVQHACITTFGCPCPSMLATNPLNNMNDGDSVSSEEGGRTGSVKSGQDSKTASTNSHFSHGQSLPAARHIRSGSYASDSVASAGLSEQSYTSKESMGDCAMKELADSSRHTSFDKNNQQLSFKVPNAFDPKPPVIPKSRVDSSRSCRKNVSMRSKKSMYPRHQKVVDLLDDADGFFKSVTSLKVENLLAPIQNLLGRNGVAAEDEKNILLQEIKSSIQQKRKSSLQKDKQEHSTGFGVIGDGNANAEEGLQLAECLPANPKENDGIFPQKAELDHSARRCREDSLKLSEKNSDAGDHHHHDGFYQTENLAVSNPDLVSFPKVEEGLQKPPSKDLPEADLGEEDLRQSSNKLAQAELACDDDGGFDQTKNHFVRNPKADSDAGDSHHHDGFNQTENQTVSNLDFVSFPEVEERLQKPPSKDLLEADLGEADPRWSNKKLAQAELVCNEDGGFDWPENHFVRNPVSAKDVSFPGVDERLQKPPCEDLPDADLGQEDLRQSKNKAAQVELACDDDATKRLGNIDLAENSCATNQENFEPALDAINIELQEFEEQDRASTVVAKRSFKGQGQLEAEDEAVVVTSAPSEEVPLADKRKGVLVKGQSQGKSVVGGPEVMVENDYFGKELESSEKEVLLISRQSCGDELITRQSSMKELITRLAFGEEVIDFRKEAVVARKSFQEESLDDEKNLKDGRRMENMQAHDVSRCSQGNENAFVRGSDIAHPDIGELSAQDLECRRSESLAGLTEEKSNQTGNFVGSGTCSGCNEIHYVDASKQIYGPQKTSPKTSFHNSTLSDSSERPSVDYRGEASAPGILKGLLWPFFTKKKKPSQLKGGAFEQDSANDCGRLISSPVEQMEPPHAKSHPATTMQSKNSKTLSSGGSNTTSGTSASASLGPQQLGVGQNIGGNLVPLGVLQMEPGSADGTNSNEKVSNPEGILKKSSSANKIEMPPFDFGLDVNPDSGWHNFDSQIFSLERNPRKTSVRARARSLSPLRPPRRASFATPKISNSQRRRKGFSMVESKLETISNEHCNVFTIGDHARCGDSNTHCFQTPDRKSLHSASAIKEQFQRRSVHDKPAIGLSDGDTPAIYAAPTSEDWYKIVDLSDEPMAECVMTPNRQSFRTKVLAQASMFGSHGESPVEESNRNVTVWKTPDLESLQGSKLAHSTELLWESVLDNSNEGILVTGWLNDQTLVDDKHSPQKVSDFPDASAVLYA